MSKNAEGWIRHNSKQQPVDDHVEVEIRTRGGEYEICEASGFAWNATEENQIMAYRLHKPAEQVEACSKPELQIKLPDGYGEIYNAQAIEHGPLQWRDRITEIDATTQELTTERAELVQKLASEGFALIGRINDLLTDAAQKHDDVGDPKNWKVGDELKAIGNCGGFSFAGEVVKVLVVRDDGGFEVATESEPDYGWFFTEEEAMADLRWHSRPSA